MAPWRAPRTLGCLIGMMIVVGGTCATVASASARTVRVAGVLHGSTATFALRVAAEQPRAARLVRGGAHRTVPVRQLRAALAHGRPIRLRPGRRLRLAHGRLVLVLRLAPQTHLRRAHGTRKWRVTSDSRRARFTCRVDHHPWRRCSRAWRPKLGHGTHTLRAAAHDPDGLTDPTPARQTYVSPGPAVPPLAASWSAFQAFGAPTSFAKAGLPSDVALSTETVNGAAVNPAAANELQRQASTYGTYLNAATYTAPLTLVSARQPLTPVLCTYRGTPCVAAMRQMMLGVSPTGADLHGGLPIPPDYVAADASDTDAEAMFFQPDYVSPAGYRGRFYEAWKLRLNPAYDPRRPISASNPKWTAASGGRVVGTATAPGHYRNWTASGYRYTQPGDPDSTYQGASWGVLATGLFIGSDEVRRADCVAGRIDHAVGLLVHNARPGHVWPAQRGDGTWPNSSLIEGMRLRFPPGMPKPRFSNRLASMLFDAAQRYGFVIDDKTNASVGIRIEPASNGHAAPECWSLLDGQHGYTALSGFPWSKLQVLATGSDALPNPRR